MLIGSFKYIYSNGTISVADNREGFKKGVDAVNEYGWWNIKICIGSFAVKKEIVDQYNISFDTTTKYGEDVEFINYCLLHSLEVKVSAEYILNYNVHNESAIAKVNFDRYDCYEARHRTYKYIKQKFSDSKDIELLYKDYLLPEAIIDTTYLLCRNGVNVFKIINYLREKNYYNVLHSVKNNKSTPTIIRKKINNFLDNPILTWGKSYSSTHYYNMRKNLALVKRMVFQ
jgi:hypothetical protein